MTTTIRIGATEVPRVGLGTNRLHDTDNHARFIREAIGAGIRHIDTAHLYSGGQSEAAIGAALAWLLHRSPATLPIPGTLSTKHVRENLAALDVALEEDDLAALGALHQAA